jgi:hypothetical protein
LNDKWFLIFEINDVGRIFSLRFENLLGEISSGEFSKKNDFFKQILVDKFSGNNEMMVSYLTRRVYRSLGGAKKRAYVPWGFRTDRKNAIDLKNNLKTVIDKGMVSVCDEFLLEEMRLFEDRKGKEVLAHRQYQGVSHFDLVTALKFSTWMLSDRDRIKDVMTITPLLELGMSRERQYLDAILGANANRTPREAFRRQMERDNMEELRSDNEVPLKYDEVTAKDMGDMTSLWRSASQVWRKR